jgi:hypothetical protein
LLDFSTAMIERALIEWGRLNLVLDRLWQDLASAEGHDVVPMQKEVWMTWAGRRITKIAQVAGVDDDPFTRRPAPNRRNLDSKRVDLSDRRSPGRAGRDRRSIGTVDRWNGPGSRGGGTPLVDRGLVSRRGADLSGRRR